jgi:hypothetical protein
MVKTIRPDLARDRWLQGDGRFPAAEQANFAD